MPSRIIRDGILTSERVDKLSPEEEVFYRRLMSVADDWGRYYARPSLLLAATYPLRLATVTEADVSRWALAVCQAGLGVLYEVGGKQFIQLLDFRQQKRSKSKFPAPPEGDAQQVLSTCSAGARHPFTQTKSNAKASMDGGSLRSPPSPGSEEGGEETPLPPEKPAVSTTTKAPSASAFDAYSAAYLSRYGVAPAQNAKVRGQFAHLVSRIPAEEAPGVAAFYVGHNRRVYVASGHAVDLLLRDCEKLRTEYLTGRKVTETEADQADRTQGTAAAFAPLLQEALTREGASADPRFPSLSLEVPHA